MSPHVMLTNGSLWGGGAEHVIATLARHLRAAGHGVTIAVITTCGEVQAELRAEGFEVLSGIADDAKWSILEVSSRIGRIVAERHVDVVHTHDLRSLTDVSATRLRTRSFRHIHTFHFGNYPHLSRKRLLLERILARVPDQLVAVGNVQRDTLIAAHKLDPERIRTIWNGVDDASIAEPPRQAFARTDDIPVVGSISTFIEQKGLPTLLEAVGIVKAKGLRFRLVLVGDGPLRPVLEADVARRGIGDVVEFVGWVPDARAVLPQFDVLVQSSYWEAMSIVILEAMAAGRPILATTVGENPFVLENERTALLVPPRDAEALAGGLTRLICDCELRGRLGRGARDSYETMFTGQAMAARYAEAYAELG